MVGILAVTGEKVLCCSYRVSFCMICVMCHTIILHYFVMLTSNDQFSSIAVNQIVTVKAMKKSKTADNLMMRESTNLKMDPHAAPQSTMTPVNNLKSRKMKMKAVLKSPQNVVRLIEVMRPVLLVQTVMMIWPKKSWPMINQKTHSIPLLQLQT